MERLKVESAPPKKLRWLRARKLRRALLGLFLLAVVWAAVVARTGGFGMSIGPARISSRHPDQAIAVAAVAAVVLAALSWNADGRRALREELRRLRFAPAVLVAAISISIDVSYWSGGAPLWLDEESIALNFRDRSVAELARPLWLGQSAPLGWLVLERAVMHTLGSSEVALRLVPLLFGVATVIAAVVVGRRWLTPFGATLFVLMCGFGLWLMHYRFEIKHYTADVFFALLLPAMAVWAVEAADSVARLRRITFWWIIAAIALWLAHGAVFVSPACAVFLLIEVWRRDGRRAATNVVLTGLIWLLSFGSYYQLSLQHTIRSGFLWTYWAEHLSPAGGVIDKVRWLVARLRPLAVNPGGTELWVGFWIVALAGLAVGSSRMLRNVLGGVALSVFVLAALGLFPLYERFVLWGVPALYLAMTLLVDRSLVTGWSAIAGRQWIMLALSMAAGVAAAWICADIIQAGWQTTQGRSFERKHELDDRGAVQWLLEQRQPGDAIVTTRLAWPAVWWYGGISLARLHDADGSPAVDSAMYEMTHERQPCPSPAFEQVLKRHARILVYFGFRDVPEGFDELALRRFKEAATLTAYHEFATLSRAAVFDRNAPAAESSAAVINHPIPDAPPLAGCVSLRPMRRW